MKPTKTQDVSIGHCGLSKPAIAILTSAGIGTVAELAEAHQSVVADASTDIMREYVRACTHAGFMPAWLKVLHMPIEAQDKPPPNHALLCGPYLPAEEWMLELAIAQLDGIAWAVTRNRSGLWLHRSKQGYAQARWER